MNIEDILRKLSHCEKEIQSIIKLKEEIFTKDYLVGNCLSRRITNKIDNLLEDIIEKQVKLKYHLLEKTKDIEF